jgi:hypothetical protein
MLTRMTTLTYGVAQPTDYRCLLKDFTPGSSSFFNLTCSDLSKLGKKSPKLDLQSQFSINELMGSNHQTTNSKSPNLKKKYFL